MRDTLLKIVIFIAVLTSSSLTYADNSLTFPAYYNSSCQLMAGNWQGYLTDPTDLYGDGGPWPITIKIVQQQNLIYGQIIPTHIPSYLANLVQKPIFANCTQGRITNLFWGNKNTCGAYSPGAELISKNMLILRLSTQNAMNGADLVMVLVRTKQNLTITIPANLPALVPVNVKTCH